MGVAKGVDVEMSPWRNASKAGFLGGQLQGVVEKTGELACGKDALFDVHDGGGDMRGKPVVKGKEATNAGKALQDSKR